MNRLNHKALMNIVAVSAIVLVSGYFGQPSVAGIGDSPLEAYFLPHETEVEGAIGAEFTSDYYMVIVPATGRLVVRLYDINLQDAGDELNIFLLRTTQNSTGTGYTTFWNYVAQSRNDSGTPDIIDIPDLARGIYFVQVKPEQSWGWNGVDYKIKADFTIFPPVVRDDVGDEKRYALRTVNQLPTIGAISGMGDVDYFECDVPYNSDVTFSLTEIGTGGNVDLEVYTAWDTMIGSATQSGASDELLYLEDLAPGQYFIRVFGGEPTQYTFTATYEFSGATDILDDVGNDLAHAMPLMSGNPSVFCLQPYEIDNDVFSIYQPEDGPLVVDVYNMFLWDRRDDLYILVLDEYGKPIAKSDNQTLTPESVEVYLPKGQYFIGVYGEGSWGFNGAIYTIHVETSGSDVGDAFNQAMPIHAIPYGSETYGYPYIGMIDTPGDEDFFQVVLKDDDGFIYLEVDRMQYCNVDVQLFDASYKLLQTSANPDVESEAIYIDSLDPGVYFIRIYSLDGEIGQYRLTPTIGTPTSTISDDIGDDMPRALPLVPYRRVNGHIWNENTSDYFGFVLETNQKSVRVHVSHQLIWDLGDDIALHVYDASGNLIGSSDNDVLEDEIVELSNLDAGIYYARVVPQQSWGMNPCQYCIVVETDVAPLPSAELLIPRDILGIPGEIIYVPVIVNNTHPRDEITSMSIGVQYDPGILEPLGVDNSGLTLEQWNAQVRYARSANTISVSMNNFSTLESGELVNLLFKIRSTASIGDASALMVLISTLNGAIVPWTDGLVEVVAD